MGLIDWRNGKRIFLSVQEMQETWFQPLGQEDPLEEEMATRSSILVWESPQTEEPGVAWGCMESMGSQKSRSDMTEQLSMYTP